MTFLTFLQHVMAGAFWLLLAIIGIFFLIVVRDSVRPDRAWLQHYVDAEMEYLQVKVNRLPPPMRDVRVGRHTVNTLLRHIEEMQDDPRHTLYHLGELSLMLKVLQPDPGSW